MRALIVWGAVLAAIAAGAAAQTPERQTVPRVTPLRTLTDLPGRGVEPQSDIAQWEQAAAHSDAVVLGRVIDKRAQWVGRLIVTTATIEVMESMRGPVAEKSRVRISYPGGRVGDIAQYVTHTPSLKLGETAVLFIDRSTSEAMRNLETFEFSVEDAKIALVAPDDDPERLRENVRIQRELQRIRAAVK
jgi:hypothetical protein